MFTRPRRTGRAYFMLFALALLVVLSLGNPPAQSNAALVDTRLGSTPGPDARADETWGGGTRDVPPEPGSKNETTQIAHDPDGVTTSGPAAPGTKNYDGVATVEVVPPATGTGWKFIACGAVSDGGWTTTSSAFETIRSCTLNLPEDGFVYLNASTSVGLANSAFEARFNLSIDTTAGNNATDRWVNIYPDSRDGTDKSAELTLLAPVTAGPHTFYFLGTRYNGTGTVQLYDPSLSVLYFPNSSGDVLSCGVTLNNLWTTDQITFQQIRACSLTLPQSGYAFISATASASLVSGGAAYEGHFRVGVDTVSGSANSDRWVNVYPDSDNGTDEAVATSLLTPVSAGDHTFYFSGRRFKGTGTLQLLDPSLNVLYFPASSVTAKVCGAPVLSAWTNNTTSYTIIGSCTLNVPGSGFAFMEATASAGQSASGAGNEWEGQFRLGVDNPNGSSFFDRWVNTYTDTADGTDRALANSGVVNISAGTHTFYFVGRRYDGSGTLLLYSPSLTVLVPGAKLFLPLVTR